MGTGGGCWPCKLITGKKKNISTEGGPTTGAGEKVEEPVGEQEQDSPVEDGSGPSEQPVVDSASASAAPRETVAPKKTKIFIVYYSTYGHIATLAKKVKEGVDTVEGVEGSLYQVPETLSPEVLQEMKAPPKDSTVPIISAAQLPDADAIIFGFPTRYGAMAAQMKAFFDSTGQLWKGQLLAGKAAGFFVSTGTQGGGQETTAWTAITQLAHHGMLFVPIGYTFGAGMFKLDEIRGGSPYGAGTFAGDGSRLPSESELELAKHQGKYTASIVKKLIGP